jgi:hypothetical protein
MIDFITVIFVSTKIVNASQVRSEGVSQGPVEGVSQGRSEGASQDLPKDLS